METEKAKLEEEKVRAALRIMVAMDGVLEDAVAHLWEELLWKLEPEQFPEAQRVIKANIKRKRWLFPLLQDAINPDRPAVDLNGVSTTAEVIAYAKEYYAEYGYDGNAPNVEDPTTDKPNFKHM